MSWPAPDRAIRRVIVEALVAQVTGTVRWRESVAFMAEQGVTSFYEVGVGQGADAVWSSASPTARRVRRSGRLTTSQRSRPRIAAIN